MLSLPETHKGNGINAQHQECVGSGKAVKI